MRKFFSDFKKFITRGNVIDMAVGVIVASAFTAIVTALTNKIIMPFINWLLSLGGTNGLESAYTFLKKVEVDGVVDLAKSIYIDWGAFITAIINFILVALVLFTILRIAMRTKGFLKKTTGEYPTRQERKELKANGVDVKDRRELLIKTKELREAKRIKAEQEALANKKPTTDELLLDIKNLLEKQAQNQEVKKLEENNNK